ncbi:YbfB/YjiJ family MFS transporter [Pseudorhodoferax soli]|uniref:Putative MFS family arabinose efflux permease n=1 Tax=Pseudorhodoferax soli TaxID=545864 RepID=A0A368XQ84_9BURK|nr:YbfB/YjiJ family MFS transporter [Pseudorhodoferax soli]RCW68677.1 putative MFS family arabinose efflux permease [Pseudorhodoferax soli]
MTNTTATANLDQSSADAWRVITAGICALILTVGLARFAYTPMLPIMAKQANLSQLAGGWLASINYAGYMAGVLMASAISDMRLKYRLYRLGLVVAVLSTAAMGMTTSVVVWAVLRFVAGLSSIAGMLLASGLVLNWLMRSGRRAELGLHFSGLGLGIALSGLAVAATSSHANWGQQWLILGAIAVLFCVPALAWMPAPARSTKAASHRRPELAPPSARWMWLSVLAYFCAGFGFAIGATFIVAILEKLPELEGQGGWVWVCVGMAAVPSTFLWDRIAKRIGSARALLLAYGLQAIAMVLPIISHHLSMNLASAVLFGGTFAGIVSLTLSMVGRRFPAAPAKAMAKMTLSYGVAQILAPALAGYLGQMTGSYDDALIVSAFLMAIGLMLMQLLARQQDA